MTVKHQMPSPHGYTCPTCGNWARASRWQYLSPIGGRLVCPTCARDYTTGTILIEEGW